MKNSWQHSCELLKTVQCAGAKKKIVFLAVTITLVILANAALQIRLNNWQGTIYDAIGQRDASVFLHELLVFAEIVTLLLCLGVAQTWLNETLKIRLREMLTRDMLDEWLKPMRAFRLTLAGDLGANPDQRLHEDVRRLAELSASLGVGLLQSTIMLTGFTVVLWGLSADVTFSVAGTNIMVPGYMVWCAVIYSALGAFFTWLAGNPLTRQHSELREAEANFRFHLVKVSESAEAAALHGGEAAERKFLDSAVTPVITVMQGIASRLATLNWVTGTYGWAGIVVPMILAAPGYFSGALTLGGLMMVVGAFYQVQGALRWFIDQFPAIAEWRAMLVRVVSYKRALTSVETLGADVPHFERKTGDADELTFDNLCVYGPHGRIALSESRVTVRPGERVLIWAPAKTGKSLYFKALAGLWVWGTGAIHLPLRDRMYFVPGIPYIPLGTLKEVLTYPSDPGRFSDEDVRRALERVRLGRLGTELGQDCRWDKRLSHEEQLRAVLVRLVLHKPAWIIHDETMTDFDEETVEIIKSLLDSEFAEAAVVGFGRSEARNGFYHRSLCLRVQAPGIEFPLKFAETPRHNLDFIATMARGLERI